MIAVAFAVVSCGETTETTTEETEKATELARGDESPVSTCKDNVCTHEVTSSRECAVEGKCPGHQYAKADVHVCTEACGKDCPHAKGGTCTCGGKGDCKGKCSEDCPHYKGKHTCTEACAADCPHAKAHVCTEECSKDCPHAKAAGSQVATKAAAADRCGGCPLKKTCKSGS